MSPEQPLRDGGAARPAPAGHAAVVKCVVWDLDGTLWDGTLAEGDDVRLRPWALPVLRALDERGILHSIASRNDPGDALERLAALRVADLFLVPQIGWGAKSEAVARVAEALDLGLDALAFVDDQPFERDEVGAALPQVRRYGPADAPTLPDRSEFRPPHVTPESRQRRLLYRSELERRRAEEDWAGAPGAFLESLGMVLSVRPAQEGDLQRAEELTLRTNQLNSTGIAYGVDDLRRMVASPDFDVLTAALEDRYGAYGTIGLAVVERGSDVWRLRLLLMSCRVIARGVGGALLAHVVERGRAAGARLRADFVDTGRNRQMFVTYRFAGFREAEREGERVVLERASAEPMPEPRWIRTVAP